MRMKKTFIFYTLQLFVFLVLITNTSGAQNVINIDSIFFKDFSKTAPLLRDDVFGVRLDSVIHFQGTVESIDTETRYMKKFRMKVSGDVPDYIPLKIMYYVYFDQGELYPSAKNEDRCAITGKLMSYTPLNTKRDSYILDIVLDKIADLQEDKSGDNQ